MSRCHNCGRETMRTEDWACQWCGYPLVSGSFGKVEKTYRQLKEERLGRPKEEPVPQPEPESEEGIEGVEAPEYKEEPKEKQQEEREETVQEPEERIEKEGEPVPETEPKEEIIQGPGPESVTELEIETETGVLAEAEAVVAEDSAEIAVEIEKKKEPEPEPEPELAPVAEELNVTELFKAYEEDDIAADERFVNKTIKITGVVSLVDAKNVSDTHYIRLAASEGDLMQSVQCMFAKKHASSLSQLEKGQVVTVQGRYNGSVIAMRMVDCVLIV